MFEPVLSYSDVRYESSTLIAEPARRDRGTQADNSLVVAPSLPRGCSPTDFEDK
jgi:hypothetical protein